MQLNLSTDLCWAVVEDGRMYIHHKNGERIVGEIFCRVTDNNGELPKAIVKMLVNICGSVEEMNEKIKKANGGDLERPSTNTSINL